MCSNFICHLFGWLQKLCACRLAERLHRGQGMGPSSQEDVPVPGKGFTQTCAACNCHHLHPAVGAERLDLWCDLSIPVSVPILALAQTHPFSRRKLEGAGASMWSRSSSRLAMVAPCNKTLGQQWCAAAVSRITWWKCVGTFWWQ